jgi:hypothetical protein
MSTHQRIDRKMIMNLRLKLILARVGRGTELADFMVDLDANAGELLALADAALTIREAYVRKRAEGALVPNISREVAYAMVSFEQLEASFEAVAPETSQQSTDLASSLEDLKRSVRALEDKLRNHPDCTYQDSDSVAMRDTPAAREATLEFKQALNKLYARADMHGFKVRLEG